MKYQPGFYCLMLVIFVLPVYGYAQQPANAFTEHFSWLLGDWRGSGEKSNLHESWQFINDSTFSGVGYFVKKNGDTIFNERIQLVVRNNNFYYIPVASNQNNSLPVSFLITTFSRNAFIAENKKHDFPQRIKYASGERNKLNALVDGSVNGKYRKEEYEFIRIDKTQ